VPTPVPTPSPVPSPGAVPESPGVTPAAIMAMSFCVTLGTKITLSTQSEKNIEDIEISDTVLGFDENKSLTQFSISKIIFANGEAIYQIYFEDGFISCSESHCLFDDNLKIFKHAYELNVGDRITGFSESKKITKIEIQKSEPVIGLILNNNGTYFANGLLSHSQDTHPSFITQTIENTNQITQSAVKNFGSQETACVAIGTKINFSENEQKNAEDYEIGDTVYGFENSTTYDLFTVIEKQIINNQVVYAIYCDNYYLECSELHSVFSFTDNTFRHPWQLLPNQYIQTIQGLSVVEKIIAKGIQPVVSLKLSNSGTFFANGILSHSQAAAPNYDLSISLPPENTFFKYLEVDSIKSDSISKNVFNLRTTNNFCGIFEDNIISTEKGLIKAKSLKKKTKVFGLNQKFEKDLFEIKEITNQISDCVEIVFEDDSKICLSKFCPVFSETQQNFVHAFRLIRYETIKLEDKSLKVKNIIDKKQLNTIRIILAEQNSFFSDCVLVHNQETSSSSNVAQTFNISKINPREIYKIIKPEMKNILPLWKYETSNDWKKAFYLLDFNLLEEDAGYSFNSSNKLNVQMSFDVNSFVDQVIMIKLIGDKSKIKIKFNNLNLNNEIESYEFENISIHFVKLISLSSSSQNSIFDFEFASEKDTLLTNLNLIKSDEHAAILEYFQGY